MSDPGIDYPALMKQALLELKQMRAKLNNLENAKTEPIAIVGLGCRFPGAANDPESFWQLLENGVDAIGEVPTDRWDMDTYYDPDPDTPGKIYTRYGGFVEHPDEFDPQFFNISPKEAVSLDPQQRMLLEVSWEALEHAGVAGDRLRGSSTGVFVGICSNDYSQRLLAQDPTEIDAYVGTGNSHSVAAGRLSYLLGLNGPSLAVDTACSSSLVAVHLAVTSLRNRECNLALAGGVNLILAPEVSINFSKARMLSRDGRCKTFDATADGYIRAEGCGVIALKRLSDALKDGDRILAQIRGSAIDHDGRSSGLTVPNGPAQQAVIRQALENARVKPEQIGYIEAHGTGTALGDPIEVGALAGVFAQNHSPEDPLAIGSVKTNIGHSEGAAGIAGLIKVVLTLQHQTIPPHLHFNQPSPHIDWERLPLTVPTKPTAWSTTETRMAGVSSFGFSGTNAHLVIEEAPRSEAVPNEVERPVHLLTLSAKTATALEQLAQRYQDYLQAHPNLNLADVCFTSHRGRSQFDHRLSIIAATPTEAIDKLANYIAGQTSPGVIAGRVQSTTPPKIAFLFTGQGSQYLGMGRQLYQTSPYFREIIDRCDAILRPLVYPPLLEILYPTSSHDYSPIHQTAYTQPALFALEYALAQLWMSWGVRPTAVMGHSLGEYVAATIAGVFSLESALKLVATRGRLMQMLPEDGAMYAVMADLDTVTEAIQPYSEEVAIAAINGSHNVISGDADWLAGIVSNLTARGIKTTRLQVSHAFHSPLMRPMLEEFAAVAAEVSYSTPKIELISNLTGAKATAEITTPQYWCRHLLQPVNFATSIQTLASKGYRALVEIGAKPTLLSMGRQCLADDQSSNDLQWLPSLRPKRADWQQLLTSLAQLHASGVSVDWSGFERDYSRQVVTLPTYPFQRQRYWLGSDRHHRQPNPTTESSQSAKAPKQSLIDPEKKRAEILQANPEQQQKLLKDYFEQLLNRVMGLQASQLDWQQRLFDLGLDSLMATELRRQLEDNLGIKVPVEFLAELSIKQFVEHIVVLLQQPEGKPSSSVHYPASPQHVTNANQTNNSDPALWIARPQPNPQASIRLFCFPYAGAGISCFRSWTKHLAPEIEVCPIQLPGRENRRQEVPLTRMKSVVQTLAPMLRPYLDQPYAFFGHSMGAMLCFELARELRRRNWQQPSHLLVSACRAPQVPDLAPPLHRLPEVKFLEKLKNLKGIPEEILAGPKLMQLFLPTLRADFELLETYFYLNEQPFDFPITAFGGLADNKVSIEELNVWREQTKAEFNLQMFTGDHFFLHTSNRELLPELAQQLQKLLILN
ncbi:acyltransferase domain-containing protein [Pleurocapsales cyanobacterium LEGE 10410]|nr:acyltransferase domain-containing protein [Pleurocapsales cyanobacterium LEGE 10410]